MTNNFITTNNSSTSLINDGSRIISVKEARKLLGKQYRLFDDDQISKIVELLNTVAKESINI